MIKKYIHLNDVLEPLANLRIENVERGVPCGIVSLNEYFSLKKGYPLFIAGAPYSGKTEFTLEILMNTSILYGWKHFIYLGEGGDAEKVFAELISKYVNKPFTRGEYSMSDIDAAKAQLFVSKHFILANHDLDFTIKEFYDMVNTCEKELNIKFDTTTFDPFNDIKEEVEYFGGREDKYLANALKQVRVDAKKNDRLNILVNHIADVRAVTDKSGNRYMPVALPNEWAGGRTWWRRAFTMLLIYRPPTFLQDENGQPFKENETQVYIQKSKPKGVGKIGMARIFYDWKKNRYYSNINGQELYSCETIKDITFKPLAENNSFFEESISKYNDDNPF